MKKRKSVTSKNTKQKINMKKSSTGSPLIDYYIHEIVNDINKIYDMVEHTDLSIYEKDILLDTIHISSLLFKLDAEEHLINARLNLAIKKMAFIYKEDKDAFFEMFNEIIDIGLEESKLLLDAIKEQILQEDYERLDMLIKSKLYGI